MKRIPFINGDEYDVLGLTGNDRRIHPGLNRAGVAAKTKRRYRRRERRIATADIHGYRH